MSGEEGGGAEGLDFVRARRLAAQVPAQDFIQWSERSVPRWRGRRIKDPTEAACEGPHARCFWLRRPAALPRAAERFGMDRRALRLVQLFLFALWANSLTTIGLADAQQQFICNESLMLQNLPVCGKSFEEMMHKVDSKKWCNLTEFILYYNNFILCTEHKALTAKCFWPNPLAEGFITGIHRQFFTNCTSDKVHWEDPSDKILVPLIFVPILLTVAMVGLVVWCSKRSDILV